MIGDQQNRSGPIRILDMLETINVHQVVGRDMNPSRAENPLAPSPEALPKALIHAADQAESEPLKSGENADLFKSRIRERHGAVDLRLRASKRLSLVVQVAIAAVPQPSAESLWLSACS